MNQIPLDRAYLCADCSMVGDDSRTCPACAGGSLLALSRVLERDTPAMDTGGLYRAVGELEWALAQ